VQLFLLAWDAGEIEGVSFAVFALNNALRAYILLSNVWVGTLSALSVLFRGYALGETFRALTLAERGALWLRGALIDLGWAIRLVTADAIGMTTALLTDPLFWIPAAIIGLAILYWRWRAFRNAVNDVIGFLWRHPLLAWAIPVIGPLIQMSKLLYTIYKHLSDIQHLAEHPWNALGIGKGSGGWSAWNPLPTLKGAGHWLGIPGLQHGGLITRGGSAVVGEGGPELLRLPAGAAVQPLQWAMTNKGPDASAGAPKQLVVQFVVGQRVLEQAIVDIMGGRLAQA
jgi:hypothetical protein